MRIDAECRDGYLARQEESLRELCERTAVQGDRLDERRFAIALPALYLGIVSGTPVEMRPPLSTPELLAVRMWQPAAADEVTALRSLLLLGVTLLDTPTGAPSMVILPGPYPPVYHPHVAPTLPGPVCLFDDFRIDRCDLADMVMSLQSMLRFEPGTWSTELSRALAPGAARWLAAGNGPELPLRAPQPKGVRTLSVAEEAGDD